MTNLRIIRHDRPDQVLADWRVVSVTLHVPSLTSAAPGDGGPLRVRIVEVAVLPDVAPIPELAQAAEHILSESRM